MEYVSHALSHNSVKYFSDLYGNQSCVHAESELLVAAAVDSGDLLCV